MTSEKCFECESELTTICLQCNTRAVPDVPELVRYDWCRTRMRVESGRGEYVRYDQAAAVVAAKDAEIERLKEQNDKFKWQVRDTCTRAEFSEEELARFKEWLDE